MILFLWVIRYFILPVYESPKYLVSIGRDQEAVDVIHKIAERNGVVVNLTVEDLQAAAAPYLESDSPSVTKFTKLELVKNSFSDLGASHIGPLFATPRLALSTSMVIYCYAALGLAYPLYNGFLGGYLQSKNSSLGDESLDATYSAYTYQAACGIPGSLLAAILVNWSRGGRKFAMAFFTIMAGIFLFVTTQAHTQVQLNALVSIAAFWENAFCELLTYVVRLSANSQMVCYMATRRKFSPRHRAELAMPSPPPLLELRVSSHPSLRYTQSRWMLRSSRLLLFSSCKYRPRLSLISVPE